MKLVEWILQGDNSEQALIFLGWHREIEEALKKLILIRGRLRSKKYYYERLLSLAEFIPGGLKTKKKPQIVIDRAFVDVICKDIRANLSAIFVVREQAKVLTKMVRMFAGARAHGEQWTTVTSCHVSSDVILRAERML